MQNTQGLYWCQLILNKVPHLLHVGGRCQSPFTLRSFARGWGAWGLCMVPRTAVLWTDISKVIPGICWSYCTGGSHIPEHSSHHGHHHCLYLPLLLLVLDISGFSCCCHFGLLNHHYLPVLFVNHHNVLLISHHSPSVWIKTSYGTPAPFLLYRPIIGLWDPIWEFGNHYEILPLLNVKVILIKNSRLFQTDVRLHGLGGCLNVILSVFLQASRVVEMAITL